MYIYIYAKFSWLYKIFTIIMANIIMSSDRINSGHESNPKWSTESVRENTRTSRYRLISILEWSHEMTTRWKWKVQEVMVNELKVLS